MEIINATKSGRDALALIPTGGGKSLTFQISAVTEEGVTFVIMPLLSLIEDNCNYVKQLGVPACSLSESGTPADKYRNIESLAYKIVYLTPEKMANSPGLISIINALYE